MYLSIGDMCVSGESSCFPRLRQSFQAKKARFRKTKLGSSPISMLNQVWLQIHQAIHMS